MECFNTSFSEQRIKFGYICIFMYFRRKFYCLAMGVLRTILFLPISLIYGACVFVRNKLFDWKILKEQRFDIPVIGIGNLSVGGTGKTPHVEYIIDLLKDKYKIATLSRGYGRQTKGFVKGTAKSTYKDIGDEPMQYVGKYPDIAVAVCEKRVNGIQELLETDHPDVIILDDAFQHRYVKPGLNILLTDFFHLYSNDFILPSGSLREFRSASKRADIIVVTKTDPHVSSSMMNEIIAKKLCVRPHQKLFFSYIKYLRPKSLFTDEPIDVNHVTTIFMVTGIANPYPFQEYLKTHCTEIYPFKFSDHHNFKEKEITDLIDEFNRHLAPNKIMVTTEKDAQRLRVKPFSYLLKDLPIYYVPIQIAFRKVEQPTFDSIIKEFMETTCSI